MPKHLITTEELAGKLGDPLVVLCDCRHDLVDLELGERKYLDGHIHGAHFLHLEKDLSGKKSGINGRHPLPDVDAFALKMGLIGCDESKLVIAYDDAGGPFAARLWWLLRWLGHDRVVLLDGGINKWTAEGRALDRNLPGATATKFVRVVNQQMTVDADFVMSNLTQPNFVLVDARAPERFRGEVEPIDPVAGHIPAALNRLFKHNLTAEGTFKNGARLHQDFSELLGDTPAERVIHQCGSGVTACHNLFAMELAGMNHTKLYPGSWSEWCSDPTRPVEKG